MIKEPITTENHVCFHMSIRLESICSVNKSSLLPMMKLGQTRPIMVNSSHTYKQIFIDWSVVSKYTYNPQIIPINIIRSIVYV